MLSPGDVYFPCTFLVIGFPVVLKLVEGRGKYVDRAAIW